MFSFLVRAKRCVGFYWGMWQNRPFFFDWVDGNIKRMKAEIHDLSAGISKLDFRIDETQDAILGADEKNERAITKFTDDIVSVVDRERGYYGDYMECMSSSNVAQNKRIHNIEQGFGEFNKLIARVFELVEAGKRMVADDLREEFKENLNKSPTHDVINNCRTELMGYISIFENRVNDIRKDYMQHEDLAELEGRVIQQLQVRMAKLQSSILKNRIPPDWMAHQENMLSKQNKFSLKSEHRISELESQVDGLREDIKLLRKSFILDHRPTTKKRALAHIKADGSLASLEGDHPTPFVLRKRGRPRKDDAQPIMTQSQAEAAFRKAVSPKKSTSKKGKTNE